VPFLYGALSIAAGGEHSLALTNDGTVRNWGSNGAGELGNATSVNSNVPVQPTGLCPVLNEVNEITEETFLSIFPNPSIGIFSVTGTEEITSIEIYNVLGELISPLSLRRGVGGEVEINLSAQPKGIYFVKVQSGEKISTQKIVIY